jgi:hypothetical protein
MQVEVAVTMERRPVTVHGHGGSLIGWFRRGGFLGNSQKHVGLVELADGTVGEYEAKEVRYVDYR